MKRIVLAGVAVLAIAGFTLPASAEQAACLTIDVTVNGEASPANGTYCLPPEGEEGPGLPGAPELPLPEAPELPGLPEAPFAL